MEPSGLIEYSPTFGTFLVLEPSSKVIGLVLSIGTNGFPSVKVGVPVCGLPWIPLDSALVLVGVTLVTVGVYLAVTSVPFLSTRFTTTGSGVPTYCLSGVKVMEPSGLMV